MAGKKRAAADLPSTEKRETRSSKVPKTESGRAAGKSGAKGTARLKTSMAASKFKSHAAPLHVNVTSTAPSVSEGQEPAEPVDPGFLGGTVLAPSSFSTGSFGWKGSKRLVVELPKGEAEVGEKVHVMINATVIGSKDVHEEGEEQEGEQGAEGAAEQTAGETAESRHEEPPEAETKESEDKPTGAEESAA
ncbi:hypothetical protein BU15DRAFT_74547 [Melanogaster broomeanus]|nr:hypothetical protein BU15DRAFT_74547 [Melanogaster broomeanus]